MNILKLRVTLSETILSCGSEDVFVRCKSSGYFSVHKGVDNVQFSWVLWCNIKNKNIVSCVSPSGYTALYIEILALYISTVWSRNQSHQRHDKMSRLAPWGTFFDSGNSLGQSTVWVLLCCHIWNNPWFLTDYWTKFYFGAIIRLFIGYSELDYWVVTSG